MYMYMYVQYTYIDTMGARTMYMYMYMYHVSYWPCTRFGYGYTCTCTCTCSISSAYHMAETLKGKHFVDFTISFKDHWHLLVPLPFPLTILQMTHKICEILSPSKILLLYNTILITVEFLWLQVEPLHVNLSFCLTHLPTSERVAMQDQVRFSGGSDSWRRMDTSGATSERGSCWEPTVMA